MPLIFVTKATNLNSNDRVKPLPPFSWLTRVQNDLCNSVSFLRMDVRPGMALNCLLNWFQLAGKMKIANKSLGIDAIYTTLQW